MNGRAQRIRLGIFVLISSVLLLIVVGFFTARSLFESTDRYHVAYQDVSVSGLEVGSPVRYLGIDVGSISDIRIDPEDVSRIIVSISLDKNTPVKVDAIANIVSLGITGLKTIEIRGGSQQAEFLAPGEYITPGSSMVAEITGRAEVIAYKVEEVLNNLQLFTSPESINKFSTLADNTSDAMSTFNAVVSENRKDIREATISINSLGSRLDMTSAELYMAVDRFNEIMQGDDISEVLGNLREVSLSLKEADIAALVESIALASSQTQQLLLRLDEDYESSSHQLNDNLSLLQQTLENLNEASRKINNDPSVLVRGLNTRGVPDQHLR